MLPKHCAEMMIGFFLLALVMSLVRDLVPVKYSVFIPVPMAMAIPFYVGANVAVDICIGALVKAYWYWTSPETAPGKVRSFRRTRVNTPCKWYQPAHCYHLYNGW